MSKYDPLSRHLRHSAGAIELSFKQIEALLGINLPVSARRHPAWWSNSGGTHVQSFAWLEAGYRAEGVDLVGETVRFAPVSSVRGLGEMEQATFATKTESSEKETSSLEEKPHPLFGVWKGLVTLDPAYDYTQPADPDWGRVHDD